MMSLNSYKCTILVMLDVGLKNCGPCVKVYPTVLRLSRQMPDTVVFARMNSDENDSCMHFLRDMDMVEVPTFLFIRDGKINGRYVGSRKGELVGEILRYQGKHVLYWREVRKFETLMSSNLKEMRNNSVAEDGRKGLRGGVRDSYGEDSATEDQLITPSTFSVAR